MSLFAIKRPDGYILGETTTIGRNRCIEEAMIHAAYSGIKGTEWTKDFYNKGYRCVEVEVKEVERVTGYDFSVPPIHEPPVENG